VERRRHADGTVNVCLFFLPSEEEKQVINHEREESVVNQHNWSRKMLYYNNKTTCFGL